MLKLGRHYNKISSWWRFGARYKYELTVSVTLEAIEPLASYTSDYIDLTSQGLLTIKRGYRWDGASGISLDTDTFMYGSLIHDALYQLIGEGIIARTDRHKVDRLLWQSCIADGMNAFRAYYVWLAVRFFGGLHI